MMNIFEKSFAERNLSFAISLWQIYASDRSIAPVNFVGELMVISYK
jgi:hypothetical protein